MTDGLRSLAEDLARRAGTHARGGRSLGMRVVGTKLTDTDMVTTFDREAEAMIIGGLRAARPDDSIVGEEGGGHVGTSGVEWHVDPIDGTTSFMYGLPTWCVSIGARDKHGALAGAVYLPDLDEMFSAARGEGATLNGNPIRCSSLTDVSKALVATGFSYTPAHRTVQSRRVTEFIHLIRDIRRMGAAAVDICFVACGRLDAYFEENLHSWDVLAAELIAREAGARSGDFGGGELRPAEVLVSAPGVFDSLSALLVASQRRHPHVAT
ncbi:MAG: inositol monophosphatase family protein [Ilumatobacteraceae bacterium]